MRADLEGHWLELIGKRLPALAADREWPVRFDHCFARILLDQLFGDCWYGHVAGRPAYRKLSDAQLAAVIDLGERVAAGAADLHVLNAQSLAWRSARKRRAAPKLI